MKKKIINLIIPIMLFYAITIFMDRNSYQNYMRGISCGTVTKVIEYSTFKDRPSIIVSDNGKKFEIIQQYKFDYDFNLINIGDRICKESYNHNFIVIRKNGKIEKIEANLDYLVSLIFLTPNRPLTVKQLREKCQCF